MFDVGFSELLVIAVVALLVLGPERLPKAARFAGLWVRRARSHWNSVKAEFENELAAEDLQRTLRETREALASAESQLRGGAAALQTQLDDAQAQLRDAHSQLLDDRPQQAIPQQAAPQQAIPQQDAPQQATLPLPGAEDAEPAPAQHAAPGAGAAREHPEHTRSQVDHSLLEPPPPVDEDDDGVPATPPQGAPFASPSPTEPGSDHDAGR